MQKKYDKLKATMDAKLQQSPDPLNKNEGVEDGAKEESAGLIRGYSWKGQLLSSHDLLLYQIDNQKIKLTDTLKLYITGIQNNGNM
jgi:hypothetical protein